MGGGKQKSSPEVDNLGQYARALFNETKSVRNEFNRQSLEALRTGGIGAQIPTIARAVEASKGQLAQDLQGTSDSLARSGLVGTPFGQSILAQQRIAGGQQIANIPTSFTQGFVNMLPNFLASMTGASVGGMGGAASAQSNIASSRNNAYATIMSAAIPKTSFSYSAGGG